MMGKISKTEIDNFLAQATCEVLINGQISGTAWLFNDAGYLLTAGHILGKLDPREEVEIRFEDEVPQIARTIYWNYLKNCGIDCAILRIQSPPIHRQPLPLSFQNVIDGEFRIVGYGETLIQRSVAVATYNGFHDPLGSSDNRLLKLRSEQLGDPGFSGGAIFSTNIHAVVAIQIEAVKHTVGPEHTTVLAMPLYRINRLWPHFNEKPQEPMESLCDKLRSARLAYYLSVELDEEQYFKIRNASKQNLAKIRSQVRGRGLTDRDCSQNIEDEDEYFRPVALDCSLTRWWNCDVIEELGDFKQNVRDIVKRLYSWLHDIPFSRKYDEWGYSYQTRVRVGLQSAARTSSPKSWRQTHQQLADFWSRQRLSIEEQTIEDLEENWEYWLNEHYHRLLRRLNDTFPLVLAKACTELLSFEDYPQRSCYRLRCLAEILSDACLYYSENSLDSWRKRISKVVSNLQLMDVEKDVLMSSTDYTLLMREFWEPLAESQIIGNFDNHNLQCMVWTQIGDLRRALGENQMAIDAYKKASIHYVPALIGSAEAYLAMEDYQDSIASLNQAIALKPTVHAFGLRGKIYYLLDRQKLALKDFNSALEIDENIGWVWLERSKVNRLLGNFTDAYGGLKKAAELTMELDQSVEINYELAEVSQQLDKYEEAIDAISWLVDYHLDLEENYSEELLDLYSKRAALYTKIGNSEAAKIDYDQVNSFLIFNNGDDN